MGARGRGAAEQAHGSEGKYISLGYHEQDDVATVLAYLKSTDTVSNICLWGRSMGAVTALMYTAKAEERRAEGEEGVMVPATLVLDSPFASLLKLIPEVVDSADGKGQYIKQIPKKVVGGLLGLGIPILRKAIKARAEFDISDLEPIAMAPKCSVPAIFIQGRNDTLVRPHHTQLLHEAYGSKVKRRIMIEGGHNTGRSSLCFEEISSFLFSSFFDDEERKTISGVDGRFPRLRVNLDDLGVPHFICRRLPYPLQKEEVITFDSLVSVAIDHASVQLQQPFTGVKIGEYKLGSTDDNYNILGYGVEAIGGESDQKLFYMRVAEQYTDSDIILLFITTRADEISDILKMRIDALLREKLANVDMASRIEQIVQKLVTRRIEEQVAQNKRKREKEEEKNTRRHAAHEGDTAGGSGEQPVFSFRLRRSTVKLFQAMIGGGSSSGSARNEENRGGATATSASGTDGVTTTTTTTATASVSDLTTTITATQSTSDEPTENSGDERKEKNSSAGAGDVNDEVHVDEGEVIATIEEVLCEIGLVSEKDRPHLHAVICDSVREVIKRELDNHRCTERERRERELEINKDHQHQQKAKDSTHEGARPKSSSSREKRAHKKQQQQHTEDQPTLAPSSVEEVVEVVAAGTNDEVSSSY